MECDCRPNEWSKSNNKQIAAIDLFKLFAASMIVFLHSGIYQMLLLKSTFLGYISIPIWAVPFFFCTSGFFLYRHIDKYKNIYSTIKKLIILYFLWTIIYSPYNLIEPLLKGTFSISMYLKNFLILGSYAHLWFIPALIYVYIFISLVKNRYILLIISVVGLIYGLLGSSYFYLFNFQVPLFENFLSDVKLFDKTRRLISLAFPFITMGYLISQNYTYLKNISIVKLYISFLIVLILYVLEIYIIAYFGWARDSFDTIFQIPLVFLIFIICINTHLKNEQKINKLATWCRKASTFIYFGHYFILNILLSITNNHLLNYPFLLFFLTFTISALLAYTVIKLDSPLLNRLIM